MKIRTEELIISFCSHSTVEEPAISIASAAQGGDVTIQNCAFVNCSQFAIQAGHRSGSFKVLNNVFVASRMAAIEIYGTCSGSNQKSKNWFSKQ